MLHMQDHEYLPPRLDVPPGVTVYTMNFGQEPHTVTSAQDRALFDVQNIPPGGEPKNFTAPATPGEYPYYCIYHGDAQGNGMAGVLVVRAAPPATTPTPRAPTPMPTVDERDTPLAWGATVAGLLGAALLLARRRG